MKCKNCLGYIHPKRKELGYKICINCSNEPKWSAVPIINHKTGNEIQIIKDPEVAAEFIAKTARVGFGTMRGISGGYKPKVFTQTKNHKEIPDKIPESRELCRKPLPNLYEKVGEEVMSFLEKGRIQDAYSHIQASLENKRIYGNHAKQLQKIIDVLSNS